MKKALKKAVSTLIVLCMLLAFIPAVPKTNAAALTQNQINMVERCNYMYNATWVCQKTITSWKSQSYFYAGSTYRVPYAWPVTQGKWVGDTSYGISVDAFLTATTDPSSIFYTSQSYYSGNAGSYAPYYGNDCSTFVTFCWGLSSRVTTSSIVNKSTLISTVTTANVNKNLKVGDALNYAGSHVVFVSAITYDASGAISAIEITEQTPPQLKKTNHTVASLVSKYGANYKIYRYSGTVPAAPAPSSNPDLYTPPQSALTSGMSGSSVSWLQAVLTQIGYPLTVDGAYGNLTATAVSSFQRDYGLPATGTADDATIAKLKEIWADKRGYYTTSANLNMREGVGTSYNVITTIPQGSQVAVIGFNDAKTWANIIYNGKYGWASLSYLNYARDFNYTISYNTNSSDAIPSHTVKKSMSITVPSMSPGSDGTPLQGWQLLRISDTAWFDGSGWVKDQSKSKQYLPGETIAFDDTITNQNAGDDSFYLCAVWGSVSTVTPTTSSPAGHGWQWGSTDAYGFMGGYGTNGQDIELSVDLCLLNSTKPSKAVFYTNGTTNEMSVSADRVTVGDASVSYNWGEQSIDNWHRVTFKIMSGIGYVFIDGKLIAAGSGIVANENYQLLFSYEGEMAIDNAIMMSSSGHVYFNCDFEDEGESNALMGSGLGTRTLLFPDKSPFTVSITPADPSVTGTGSVTLTATPSAGNGHTYLWTCTDARLLPYLSGTNTNTLVVNITEDLSEDITAALLCTVTSDGGITNAFAVTLNYTAAKLPEAEIIPGDMDMNGSINPADLNIIKRIIGGAIAPNEYQFTAADINSDGQINALDSNLLTRIVTGSRAVTEDVIE